MVILCKFLLILDNFSMNRNLNLKKVSFYKPPLTPFRPCPAKQQGKILSFQLRGKTNRQMLCIKGGQKGDKNWWKHVRARYYLRYHPSFCSLPERTSIPKLPLCGRAIAWIGDWRLRKKLKLKSSFGILSFPFTYHHEHIHLNMNPVVIALLLWVW